MSDIFMDSDGHIIRNSMVDEHSIIKITEKVPDAKNIGKIICGETNSNILTFEMNRFYDNVDMISKNIKFIIKTPSFSFDDYASNVQHNANLIRFSWVVPYSATQEAGNVNVAIEFFDDSYSLKTMPFIIKVDKSINSEETQLEVPTNWYISIESRILQLENKTNENIADAVEDYMNEHPVQAVSDEHIEEVAIASFGNDDFNSAVNTQVNAYLAKNKWTEKMCPNLYMGAEGSIGENGNLISYNNTINVFKELGIKQVSLHLFIGSYENDRFKLITNIDYKGVIDKAHENGITIKSCRFSMTKYGKDNTKDKTKLANFAVSIHEIFQSLNLGSECDWIGILNECQNIYGDADYVDIVIQEINKLQSYGYKVAITDNVKVMLSVSDSIISACDYIGFNDYPHLTLDNDFSISKLSKAFTDYGTKEYYTLVKNNGVKILVSENGCSNKDTALIYPLDGGTGNYNGMTSVVAYYKAFKDYCDKSGLLDIIETFNPWYTEFWEDTEEMKELFK